jgi:hypothetical protein
MNKPKISVIYLDMDGVIANFIKRYEELFGMKPERADKSGKFNRQFDMFIHEKNFQTLDLMPDASKLLEFLRKAPVPTQILSSTAREDRHDEISKQKMVWLQTHGITFKPNFVPGKKLKKNFAKPDALIIDDTESIIDDWRNAGGIAIWHKDAETTITQLKMYI